MGTCRKCKEVYEGLKCKPCTAKYMREWNEKNPDKVKAIREKKYLSHKESIDARNKEWAEKNREKSNAIKKAYKIRNREKYLEQQRKYANERYLKNRDFLLSQKKTPEALEVLKKWRDENRVRISALSLEKYHQTEDKTKFKARQAVRYGLKNGKIVKPNECQVCSSGEELHAHHDDYQKPLQVTWLCVTCHKKVHSKFFNKG